MKALVKWGSRLAIWVWVGWWIAQIFIGDLGASPAQKLNHQLGFITLTLLSLNLALGVLLALLKPAPRWLRFFIGERRFWGVSSFLVLCLHVFFYFVNEGFEPKAWQQLVSKTYLLFGTTAFLILTVLALTSNNFSVRRLGGARWKNLHRAVYAVQLLLFGHILLIEKADLVFYGTWLGVLALAQLVRVLRHGGTALFARK